MHCAKKHALVLTLTVLYARIGAMLISLYLTLINSLEDLAVTIARVAGLISLISNVL